MCARNVRGQPVYDLFLDYPLVSFECPDASHPASAQNLGKNSDGAASDSGEEKSEDEVVTTESDPLLACPTCSLHLDKRKSRQQQLRVTHSKHFPIWYYTNSATPLIRVLPTSLLCFDCLESVLRESSMK